jgi:hypothetical protein
MKRILEEYKTLFVKLAKDATFKAITFTPEQPLKKKTTRHNLGLSYDVDTLLALPCIISLLKCVNSLMKFTQFKDVFVSGYVAALKIYKAKLFMSYYNPKLCSRWSSFKR